MGSDNTPRVSIGLPVFNGANYLAKALDSLIAQTFTDFELIISDNASTDATPDICREYLAKDPRVKYHGSAVNRGAAWNFNNTFRLSRGKLFKWTAHDDLYCPTFLERCVSALDQDPSLALSFTKTIFIDENDHELGEYAHPLRIWNTARRERFLQIASAGHIVVEIFGVIRADILRKTPLIAPYAASDRVLLGELALYGRFHQVPECLFLHREHAERSIQANREPEAFTAWFDSSKSGRFVMPQWRRLFGHALSVARGPIEPAEKARLLVDICRVANWSRGALVADISRVMKQARKGS